MPVRPGLIDSGRPTRVRPRNTPPSLEGLRQRGPVANINLMSRSDSAVHVHLVFATLERRPFLSDAVIRAEMHAFLGGTSNTLKCQSMIVGGVEDHVHILATQGKTVSLSYWVQELKRASSIWVKQRDPKLSQFAWQSGYGAHSVSNGDVAKIRR